MAGDQSGAAPPAQLGRLFCDGGGGRVLPVALPPGRLVWPGHRREAARPAYWLSEQPATAALWRRLRAEHGRSGLWPLLLGGLYHQLERPWIVGEVNPEPVDQIDDHDAARFLRSRWTGWVELVEETAELEGGVAADFHEVAPFGRAWPGLTPAGTPREDPAAVADCYAGLLADGTARLGLAAADRSADTLAATGWYGAGNYVERTAPLAAVVRSWEDRFSARVVGIGYDTLHLSVAAPPVTQEHALLVAAEHFAFCTDNIVADLIGFKPNPLAAYAEQIRGQRSWSFWWD